MQVRSSRESPLDLGLDEQSRVVIGSYADEPINPNNVANQRTGASKSLVLLPKSINNKDLRLMCNERLNGSNGS
jgi:hypothetical protein